MVKNILNRSCWINRGWRWSNMLNEKEKKQLLINMISRVESGFLFIKSKYLIPQLKKDEISPDILWLRSIYILFSFYFEILLKSMLIPTQKFEDVASINQQFKKLGHNIQAIGNKLGKKTLTELEIKKISLKKDEYIITTSEKTIYVKDFTDIRYDFIKNKIKNITKNEDYIIQQSMEGAEQILNKIKAKHTQ